VLKRSRCQASVIRYGGWEDKEMKIPKVVNFFIEGLSKEIQHVPDGFYDIFEYTTTGNNFTHPRTIGYITKVVWGIQNAAIVENDLRINEGGTCL
jgi:hypothetical protein